MIVAIIAVIMVKKTGIRNQGFLIKALIFLGKFTPILPPSYST